MLFLKFTFSANRSIFVKASWFVCHVWESRDSVFGTVAKLQAACPAEAWNLFFFLLQNFQTVSGYYEAFYLIGTGKSTPRVKSPKLETHKPTLSNAAVRNKWLWHPIMPSCLPQGQLYFVASDFHTSEKYPRVIPSLNQWKSNNIF
jgi:hypothetical protein